jgi:MFS family permease
VRDQPRWQAASAAGLTFDTREDSVMTTRDDTATGKPSLTEPHVRPGLVLATVALVQFLVSVDLSIVNIALPQIGDQLGFSSVDLTWVINAYALTFGGLLLLGGKAADRYGRGRVLSVGLALFGLASLAGGLAQTPAALVTARAFQGAGAAALAPAALSLLTSTFPSGRARAKASASGARSTHPAARSVSWPAACSPSTRAGGG